MLELFPSDSDDPGFLQLVQRIVNGALAALRAPEVYLVQVDNWFDHKWLGWWSSWEHGEPRSLCVPPFNPNRVRSQQRFVLDAENNRWTSAGPGRPLHLRQPGRRASRAQRLEQFSKAAAFIWYSGNTASNGAGSLMLYLARTEGYAWYVSFAKEERWKVKDECRITRREILAFEERGRQMEVLGAKDCGGSE
jgi:hypothetical protein